MLKKPFVITFSNQKGGVAKTTSSAALAYILGSRGYKVLAVDTDSQCNMTALFGQNAEDIEYSLNEVMLGIADINKVIIKNVEPNVDLIPASPYLSTLEMKIINAFQRESILANALKGLQGDYDFIVFDTAPALGIMTVNVYMASDGVVVPSEADFLSFKSIASLNDTLREVKRVHDIKLLGILFTRVERLKGDKTLMQNSDRLASALQTKVYEVYIRAQKNVKESRLEYTNVVKYSEQNRRKGREDAGTDYEKFADELLCDLGVLGGKIGG